MAIHTVKVHVSGIEYVQWDTESDPREFLKTICPEGYEGVQFSYTEYDENGVVVHTGWNIGKFAA